MSTAAGPMDSGERTGARNGVKGWRARAPLALAGLLALSVGPMASPPPVTFSKITLDDLIYKPGSTPTLCFTSSGAPRQAFFLGNERLVFLEFSTAPGASTTSPFPPYLMGIVQQFGQIEIQLNTITCFSKEQFIQGFVEDPLTGQLVEFTNEVFLAIDYSECDPNDPPGGSGCGPGFWRQDGNLASWPIPLLPQVPFGGIFEDAFPGRSLLEVLREGAGPLNALGRQTVAALLNAESPQVDFDLTSAEVIAAFDQVFPGTSAEYSALTNVLRALNEQGCTATEGATAETLTTGAVRPRDR